MKQTMRTKILHAIRSVKCAVALLAILGGAAAPPYLYASTNAPVMVNTNTHVLSYPTDFFTAIKRRCKPPRARPAALVAI